MNHILFIETATKVCSAGVASENGIIALQEDKSMQYSHSSRLNGFIENVVKEAGLAFNDLNAVAVSMGPGSYTGLRIGVSAAKGLCYGLDIPLISVNTLKAMAHVALNTITPRADYYVPMIDARRMEVYNAVFDASLNICRETIAEIIEADAFSEYLTRGKVAFFGDGAPKCRDVITHSNAGFFSDINPSVEGMLEEAFQKFRDKNFEDVAYFEPYYLKDFVAGKPSVKGLR